jgi:hypothetical protein
VKQGHRQRGAGWAVAVATVLLSVALVPPVPAGASGVAKASVVGSESVTAGTWKATASTTSFTFTGNTDQTSTVTNTGTVALSAISYKVVVSNPASGSPSFTLWVCPVAWSANKCSGGSGTQVGTTVAKNSTTTVTSSTVPALSGAVYLQVEPAAVTSTVTVGLSTLITSPTQLRAAVKTNQ